MSTRALALAALSLATALPLHAQIRDVPAQTAPRAWATGWIGMYTTVDAIGNPTDAGVVTWRFDDNVFAYGAGAEYEVAQGLLLGAEASYAKTNFEVEDNNIVTDRGSAGLLGLFGTGRLRYGGNNTLGGYLKGMAGAFGYQMGSSIGTNFDLALSTGAGLEYRLRSRAALYLEWNQIWAYHEKEGIDGGNTGKHSVLRLGFRKGVGGALR